MPVVKHIDRATVTDVLKHAIGNCDVSHCKPVSMDADVWVVVTDDGRGGNLRYEMVISGREWRIQDTRTKQMDMVAEKIHQAKELIDQQRSPKVKYPELLRGSLLARIRHRYNSAEGKVAEVVLSPEAYTCFQEHILAYSTDHPRTNEAGDYMFRDVPVVRDQECADIKIVLELPF